MIVNVNVADQSVELVEPEVLNRLHVSANAPTEAVLAALKDLGAAAPKADHVYLDIEGLKKLAEGQVADDWATGFQKMIEFATKHGWVNAAGTHVMAHIERG